MPSGAPFEPNACPNSIASPARRPRPAPELPGGVSCLTFTPQRGEDPMGLFGRFAAALAEREATPLHLMIFGATSLAPAGAETMRRLFGRVDWPVTWVEGASCDRHPVAGLQAFTTNSGATQRLTLEGQVVASVFEDGSARHCLVGGLTPETAGFSRADQALQAVEKLDTLLEQAGFSLADTVRTWFFLDDILSWYGDFNEARRQAYAGVKFESGSVPASTGISGRNPAGAALELAAWAMQSTAPTGHARGIASPLQCPAAEYGSIFSRAMELASGTGRLLFVSGTASIAPEGRTLWQGNVVKQVSQTMDIVEAILHSRRLGFSDLTRAIAYFKRAADKSAFKKWCVGRGLRSLPAVMVQADVCREDLLFEFEADAAGSLGLELAADGAHKIR